MHEQINTIDLDKMTDGGKVHNLAGKTRGEHARIALGLDELDKKGLDIRVVVPDHIYAISSSYFLGLFSKSVVRAGSAEKFLARFHFEADEPLMEQIVHGIDRCLAERDPVIH